MIISKEIKDQYKIFDPEADLFFRDFDEPEGAKILEIGSQHSPIASMLTKAGFNVTGIDLRDCDQERSEEHTSELQSH